MATPAAATHSYNTRFQAKRRKGDDDEDGEGTRKNGPGDMKCSVCLDDIKEQEVGETKPCGHVFCSVCILEWTRTRNTCPLDRRTVRNITISEKIGGPMVREVAVNPPPSPLSVLRAQLLSFISRLDEIGEEVGFLAIQITAVIHDGDDDE